MTVPYRVRLHRTPGDRCPYEWCGKCVVYPVGTPLRGVRWDEVRRRRTPGDRCPYEWSGRCAIYPVGTPLRGVRRDEVRCKRMVRAAWGSGAERSGDRLCGWHSGRCRRRGRRLAIFGGDGGHGLRLSGLRSGGRSAVHRSGGHRLVAIATDIALILECSAVGATDDPLTETGTAGNDRGRMGSRRRSYLGRSDRGRDCLCSRCGDWSRLRCRCDGGLCSHAALLHQLVGILNQVAEAVDGEAGDPG